MGKIRQYAIQKILDRPDKYHTQAADALSFLFRHVLMIRSMRRLSWDKHHEAYFKRNPKRDKKKDRGNLTSFLSDSTFSWQTFKKSIDFLQPRSAIFRICVKWEDGHERQYIVQMSLDDTKDDTTLKEDGTPTDMAFPIKGNSTALTRVFHQMCIDEAVDKEKWEELLTAYVESPVSGVGDDPAAASKEKNARDRDLKGARFSWNVFRRALVFLQVSSNTFSLEMEWRKDYVTIHSTPELPVFM